MGLERELDRAVRHELYRFFVDQGRPPVAAELADALAIDHAEVEDSLRRLAGEHAIVLAPGTPYVWMAMPLSAIPTPFMVEVTDRRFFANCIWDALGVVAMLGGTGRVRTFCPDCRSQMSVTVADNRLSSGEGVVHFAVPAVHWWDDIGFT